MDWFSRFRNPWGPMGALSRIAFLDRLGLGGQGEVWLARDRLLSRLVTVKKVDTQSEAASLNTLRSLRARVDVAHPAIPTVFAVIPDGRKTWLVGEFVKGLPLTELIDELSPESVYLIAKDLISALGCLERLGLVHGDLSPNNVVVDVSGQVRLLDFESCSRVGEPLTAGATPGFSSPERHSRKVSLPTSDTWSVGALIIWLITQSVPTVIYDDARKAVAVDVHEGRAGAAMLSDLLNLASSATRIEPDLRPSACDLQQTLKLSYRWLEPLSRSDLSSLVQQRTPSVPVPKTVFDFPEDGAAPSGKIGLIWAVPLAVVAVLGMAAYQPVHSYSLRIDTAALSPTTALPSTFGESWLSTTLNAELPASWTQAQAANSEHIALSVACDRGICELLLEHQPEDATCRHHSPIVNTADDRVWHAAISDLARAISSE
jgi:serine/threonine protein kinase